MSELVKPGYYYEHKNGSIHWKPFLVVDAGGGPSDYFDSPLIRRWWRVEAQPAPQPDWCCEHGFREHVRGSPACELAKEREHAAPQPEVEP